MARGLWRGGAARGAVAPETALDLPPRPPGPLVWMHAPTAAAQSDARMLIARLRAEGEDCPVLVTAEPGHYLSADLLCCPAPPDTPEAAAEFMRRMAPDVLVWLSGGLRPHLVAATAGQGMTRILADTGGRPLDGGPWFGRAAMLRQTLGHFDRILARGPTAAAELRRAGAAAGRVEATGPLEDIPPAPWADPAALERLSARVSARPIWAALGVSAAEVPIIAAAQKTALRSSLRLLLVALPRDEAGVRALVADCARFDLVSAEWDRAYPPDETVQVVWSHGVPSAEGLWLRLAALTFLGGTILGGGGASPAIPAALGSAVLHGPLVTPWKESYRRLMRAGAAREVDGADSLGEAVSTLIRPDRAAAMSLGAWDAVSKGATVTNRILDLIRAGLDGEAV